MDEPGQDSLLLQIRAAFGTQQTLAHADTIHVADHSSQRRAHMISHSDDGHHVTASPPLARATRRRRWLFVVGCQREVARVAAARSARPARDDKRDSEQRQAYALRPRRAVPLSGVFAGVCSGQTQ